MKTISMSELNQRISAVTREVIETGQPVRVTNRGRAVLRLVPEPTTSDNPLQALVDAGLATAPRRQPRVIEKRRQRRLSRRVDEIIDDIRSDRDI
jgi:prevent-host-death family protein